MHARQTSPTQNNNGLVFLVAALFMITLAFIAVFYVDAGSSLTTIKDNQKHNSQKTIDHQQDLTQITCSMWHTMTTSPYVHPSPDIKQRMTTLCG